MNHVLYLSILTLKKQFIDLIFSFIKRMLLLWDFDVDVLFSATATPLAPKYPPDDADENRNVCPILDITKPNCNCSNFPLTFTLFFYFTFHSF